VKVSNAIINTTTSTLELFDVGLTMRKHLKQCYFKYHHIGNFKKDDLIVT
jgi:hypothetical protein